MLFKLFEAKFKLIKISSKQENEKGKSPALIPNDGKAIYVNTFQTLGPRIARADLEDLIVALWSRIWLGLYEIDIEESRYHGDRLMALYKGAGLSVMRNADPFKTIFRHLSRRFYRVAVRWDDGIASLKLSGGLSIFTLHAMYEVLTAYSNEISVLRQLYSLLQRKQLRLNGLCSAKISESAFELEALRQEFNQIARPMGQRLALYDIRANTLNDEVREELAKQQQNGVFRRSEYIYDMAFPERLRGRRGGSTSSGPSRYW